MSGYGVIVGRAHGMSNWRKEEIFQRIDERMGWWMHRGFNHWSMNRWLNFQQLWPNRCRKNYDLERCGSVESGNMVDRVCGCRPLLIMFRRKTRRRWVWEIRPCTVYHPCMQALEQKCNVALYVWVNVKGIVAEEQCSVVCIILTFLLSCFQSEVVRPCLYLDRWYQPALRLILVL